MFLETISAAVTHCDQEHASAWTHTHRHTHKHAHTHTHTKHFTTVMKSTQLMLGTAMFCIHNSKHSFQT